MYETVVFAVAFIIAFAVYLLLSRWAALAAIAEEPPATKTVRHPTADDESTVATTIADSAVANAGRRRGQTSRLLQIRP